MKKQTSTGNSQLINRFETGSHG